MVNPPNEIPLTELEARYDYARPEDFAGVDETCCVDRATHSLFGASKATADLVAQEYGLYFKMKVEHRALTRDSIALRKP